MKTERSVSFSRHAHTIFHPSFSLRDCLPAYFPSSTHSSPPRRVAAMPLFNYKPTSKMLLLILVSTPIGAPFFILWARNTVNRYEKDEDATLAFENVPQTISLAAEHETIRDALERDLQRRINTWVDESIKYEHQGSPVWLSLSVDQGHFRHWVLITGDQKYELQQVDGSQAESSGSSKERHGQYRHISQPWTIDQERRSLALSSKHLPIVDKRGDGLRDYRFTQSFHTVLIGWTNQPASEVQTACENTISKFGPYHLLFNSCQHFVRELARKVVTTRSRDWAWFEKTTSTSYKSFVESSRLPTLQPLFQASVWLRHLKGMTTTASPEELPKFQNQIRTLERFVRDETEAHIDRAEQLLRYKFEPPEQQTSAIPSTSVGVDATEPDSARFGSWVLDAKSLPGTGDMISPGR